MLHDNEERKQVFLRSMLSIFQDGGWNMTIVAPQIGDSKDPRWINHVEVNRHLVNSLGYDKDAVEIEMSHNVRVEPNGEMDFEQPIE